MDTPAIVFESLGILEFSSLSRVPPAMTQYISSSYIEIQTRTSDTDAGISKVARS